jgi:hypothetical protein
VSPPEIDSLSIPDHVAEMRAVFAKGLDGAKHYRERLAECHALLLKIATTHRPVSGGLQIEARELLARHGVLASQEEGN